MKAPGSLAGKLRSPVGLFVDTDTISATTTDRTYFSLVSSPLSLAAENCPRLHLVRSAGRTSLPPSLGHDDYLTSVRGRHGQRSLGSGRYLLSGSGGLLMVVEAARIDETEKTPQAHCRDAAPVSAYHPRGKALSVSSAAGLRPLSPAQVALSE
jgi:hypothetical protein